MDGENLFQSRKMDCKDERAIDRCVYISFEHEQLLVILQRPDKIGWHSWRLVKCWLQTASGLIHANGNADVGRASIGMPFRPDSHATQFCACMQPNIKPSRSWNGLEGAGETCTCFDANNCSFVTTVDQGVGGASRAGGVGRGRAWRSLVKMCRGLTISSPANHDLDVGSNLQVS
jgi:hypothetical protein